MLSSIDKLLEGPEPRSAQKKKKIAQLNSKNINVILTNTIIWTIASEIYRRHCAVSISNAGS